MMGQIVLPLLMLVAYCYCAPATLFAAGGKFGYDSRINGTVGGHVKATRDGLSVNGAANSEVGASWEPKVFASGGLQLGEHVIGGDASLATVINNNWKPSIQGEIGRTSNGTWLIGAQPQSELVNQFLLNPKVQVETGDKARAFAGFPVEDKNGGKQAPVATYPYMYYPAPQGPNAYYMPQGAYAYNMPQGPSPYNMPQGPSPYNMPPVKQ